LRKVVEVFNVMLPPQEFRSDGRKFDFGPLPGEEGALASKT